MALAVPLRWRAFRVAKAGNAESDYEDASAADAGRGRFAIADGASEASFAGSWARLLVERFVGDTGKPWRGLDWIEPARKQWASDVDALSLPWYADEKRSLGAFATFLGFAVRARPDSNQGVWRAIAVGDACLFHTRDDALELAFPVTRSSDFVNHPDLLNSRRAGADRSHRARGRWQSKDRFLLMTDALAQWFLLETEAMHEPLAQLRSFLAEPSPEAAFASWVNARRRESVLRNDDVTLMIVDLD
jgi:hypothetical protein